MSASSTCDSLLCASRSPLSRRWNREVFLWERRQRPAAVAPLRDRLTPYSSALLSDLPGLKDTVHHPTRLNACKMSNQGRARSLRPPRQVPLPAGRGGRARETPLMNPGADPCFPSHESPVPGFISAGGGNVRGHGCPPYIKFVKYSIRVEMWLTPISHPIRNDPAMEADTCGFFMSSEVSPHSAERETHTASANM